MNTADGGHVCSPADRGDLPGSQWKLYAKKEQDGDGDGGGGGGGGGGKCTKGSDDSLTSVASKEERDKARKKSGTAPPPKVMYINYSN